MNACQFIRIWFYEISKSYALPMSLLSCLIAFLCAWNMSGNIFWGIIATLCITYAHLGTNVFDIYIKSVDNTPEQLCETIKIEEHNIKTKDLFILSLCWFGLAFLCGLMLMFNCGRLSMILTFFGGVFCIFHPKFSKYCLSELGMFVALGPFVFCFISYAMLGYVNIGMILFSIPVSLFMVIITLVKQLTCFNSYQNQENKTLSTILKNENNLLKLITVLIIISFVLTFSFVFLRIVPYNLILEFSTIPIAINLCKNLSDFISSINKDEPAAANCIQQTIQFVSIYYAIAVISLIA